MQQHILSISIDGGKYEWHHQYITGAELKKLAEIDEHKELYLSVKSPWPDELIANDANVDLARPGIEHFFTKKQLRFTINAVVYEWDRQYITGLQLREIGKISADHDIYLQIKPPYEDELITDDTRVDLARPGVEHFITKERAVVIIVNGREKQWESKKISFAEVVTLAFGTFNENATTAYTVTYKRGPVENPEGSMVKGNIVYVKTKMIFNVTATDKS